MLNGEPIEDIAPSNDTIYQQGQVELVDESPKIIQHVRTLVSLPRYSITLWLDKHDKAVLEFISGPGRKTLFIYLKDGHLVAQPSPPNIPVADVMFFVTDVEGKEPMSLKSFNKKVQHGFVSGNVLKSLLIQLEHVFFPALSTNNQWHKSIKTDFMSQFQKFMASLTDTTYHLEGRTVLYVPKEYFGDIATDAQDKEMVVRLETLVVQWTRQIKEVLNSHNANDTGDRSTPIDEINYWRARCDDLSGIYQQLHDPKLKHILDILDYAKSPYLEHFRRCADLINEGTLEAQDNLKFLNLMVVPCENLDVTEPKGILSILPRLLMIVRFIWKRSRLYNTDDLIVGLLQKINNQVINRCIEKISLEDIFFKDVLKSVTHLNECIRACEEWKGFYVSATSSFWSFDEGSIFAQLDAFVQRCRDLLEVCEAQVQFARKCEGGASMPLPHFGNTLKVDIAKGLEDIENTFNRLLLKLWTLKDEILDVKGTNWYDEYNSFKQGVKDMEIMTQKLILSSFHPNMSADRCLDTLEIFYHLAKRDAIKRTVEKKCSEMWGLLINELTAIKAVFEAQRKAPEILRSQPDFSGSAYWSRSLLKRAHYAMSLFQNAYFLPSSPASQEAASIYETITVALEDYNNKCHREWLDNTDLNAVKGLDKPILVIIYKANYDANFDKNLSRLFPEINYFQKLKFDIPFQLVDVFRRRDDLRITRENVLMISRDYNEIIDKLSMDEQNLFRERLRAVERKLKPGLSKLTWESKGVLEVYLKDCKKMMIDLQSITDSFLTCKRSIKALCQKISETVLLHMDAQQIYTLWEYTKMHDNYFHKVASQLGGYFESIEDNLQIIFEFIREDGKEVMNQWAYFIKSVDEEVIGSMKKAIKFSLLLLSKSIIGENKGRDTYVDVQPIIGIEVQLENQKIEFAPSLSRVQEGIVSVGHKVMSVVSLFKPFTKQYASLFDSEISQTTTYNAMNDDEFRKMVTAIQTGIANTDSKAQKYLRTWDAYKEIWEINKDAFIRRYAKLKPALSTFDADINRYNEVANNIQKEETLVAVDFARLDCSPLKHSLVGHCNNWQNKLTGLLNTMASTQLQELHDLMTGNTIKLKKDPTNLDELAAIMQVNETLATEIPTVEKEFGPLQEKYQILEKYEVSVTENEKQLLATLPGCWAAFTQLFDDSTKRLKESKTKFKSELMLQFDELQKNLVSLRDQVSLNGPYKFDFTYEKAISSLEDYRRVLTECNYKDVAIKKGLALFGIHEKSTKDNECLENELENLQNVWDVVGEFNQLIEKYKKKHILEVNIAVVDDEISKLLKKLAKYAKDCREWDVYSRQRDQIQLARKILPLIQELSNPSFRERHWKEIMDGMKTVFDPKSDDLSFGPVLLSMGLENHQDLIFDVSAAANKELGIENELEKMNQTWGSIKFNIGSYKEERGYLKVCSVDYILDFLEENQVSLSSMKSSKFAKAFEGPINDWERKTSMISELVDILLIVQKQWMYLENIFIGAEDIRKQLPRESKIFDDINAEWHNNLKGIQKSPTVLEILERKTTMQILNQMNIDLEKIQKCLDMYLETKRQAFPRFFFISNDDLLEILGQAKDPNSIQIHFKKLFDNIYKLEIKSYGTDQYMQHEALGMYSADGEYVKFHNPVKLDGPVENWLQDVEAMMRQTLHRILPQSIVAVKKYKKDKWIKEWPGQLLLTTALISWTSDCNKALHDTEKGDKEALRFLRKKESSDLKKYGDLVLTDLSKIDRKKLMALITIGVHSRDVIEKMIKNDCNNVNHFDWLSQLRFYWESSGDNMEEDCFIRQINTVFRYGYEYLGNSGRLVITPLTDRCYMTLTTALSLFRGGSPNGPAGTGKTETVKDLGKSLGKFVVVQNCSEALDFKSMGRMLSGLAQTGAWGCFDEFNRIDIEVLSVVAQQVSAILSALARKAVTMIFEGQEIKLNHTCGIFITMNPGYAGRTELPDNLKALFRPVAMMVPDSAMIAEIMLFAEGFSNTRHLAKKIDALYRLAGQQLSKQDHYDFNLRSLTSALRNAGLKKRQNPNIGDEVLIYLSMVDSNVPRLTADDVPLFMSILNDLFPAIELPTLEHAELKAGILQTMDHLNLEKKDSMITKCIQLYETKLMRHGVMVVGESYSGKSTVWLTLQATLNHLSKTVPEKFLPVKTAVINPKSVSLGELYGEFNFTTNEWTDGILSSIMRTACQSEKPEQTWITFDGPVDTLWIESMNTVLDDNKVLTLTSGERIALIENVSLLFEVENLSTASPATVSRAGMIFMDYKDLGWKPFIESWLKKKTDNALVTALKDLIAKYFDVVLDSRKRILEDLVSCTELSVVQSFTIIFDALVDSGAGTIDFSSSENSRLIELWFAFALVWSFGACLKETSRRQFDIMLRSIDGRFPTKDTVFEYFVDVENKTWGLWEEKISANYKLGLNKPAYKIFIPTVDTLRNEFIIKLLIDNKANVMAVGDVGTGKTASINQILEKVCNANNSNKKTLNLAVSAQTSSFAIQQAIENRIEKRTKNVYVPAGGKKLIIFIDDFNMPAKDAFGSQPPIELIKHWMEYGYFFDRKKQFIKYLNDVQLVVAMTPVGGRNIVTNRVLSRFNVINVTMPTEASVTKILETILENKLVDFEEDIKCLKPNLASATQDIYRSISASFLPTPSKSHYLFNFRDMLRVFQGLLKSDFHAQDSKEAFTKLWVHETYRVFADRLMTLEDKEIFNKLVEEKLLSHFTVSMKQLVKDSPILFLNNVIDESGDEPLFQYGEITSVADLKKTIEQKLEDYNNEPNTVKLDIVLFKDALEQICKISRVLAHANGHILLLGPGGSGRQTMARLASYVSKCSVFGIKPTKNYRHSEFREDLKTLYKTVGVENKSIVFLINDQQILHDAFMEDISNLLATGEIPGLFTADEFGEIKSALSNLADKEEDIQRIFIDRVRTKLHVVFCASPSSEKFKSWMRMFPAFINNVTVNCFTDWPEDALEEVANKFIEKINIDDITIKLALSKMFVQSHTAVKEESLKMALEMKRYNYITPVNFLELLNGFQKILTRKKQEILQSSMKLKNGLQKLEDTKVSVEKISKELEQAKIQVAKFQKECDDYLVVIVQQKREADDQAKSVSGKAEKLGIEEAEVRAVAEAAQADLDLALPALMASVKALEAINKKDLNEIRSYGKPPALVEKVMEAVMVLKKSEPTWEEAKRQLGNPNFIKTLVNFDKDNISDKILKKTSQYCSDENFNPDIVGRVSGAAKSLCMWVRAMETYGNIYRQVQPKREKLKSAQEQLEKKQASLREAKNKLEEVQHKLELIRKQYDEKLELKEKLRKDSEEMQIKLQRAEQLVTGLSGEKIRWEAAIKQYEESYNLLPGDCILAAAFVSYCGPFDSIYRQNLIEKSWAQSIENLMIPHSSNFRVELFLGKQVEIQEWNSQGLPTDAFSTQNGVLITRSDRWPLIIDPQSQASEWIKKLEAKYNVRTIDLRQNDYMKQLENAIQYGVPVLINGIEEKIDPSLDPIISKVITTRGAYMSIKFGDKEIEFNPNFKLYLTTKLPNPHFQSEVFAKTSIVNFAVKEKGLEDQLLGIVVKKEKPDLEEQRASLIVNVSKAKQKLIDLEDQILYLLSTAQGSLLDDAKLVEALHSSKSTSEEVVRQLHTSEQTEKRIDQARESYRPCAERAASLFFVLKDMSVVDPMYQYSLEFYVSLFEKSIANSKKSDEIVQRLDNLNKYHTYAVYKTICRGLFEKHKLLFALRITMKILERKGQINRDEYEFFLKGGLVLDKDSVPPNPCSEWMDAKTWENIFELDKISALAGIVNAMEQYERDWKQWYLSAEPDSTPLPSEWENKLNAFEKMIIIRTLRSDRIIFSARNFVAASLSPDYVEPPFLDIHDVLLESQPKTPLLFILSPGVDPLIALEQLALKQKMENKFRYVSLGQGQSGKATFLISEGMREGNWVFLANCHLSLSWLPTLEKIIDAIPSEQSHPDFRLWISSSPHPNFPISILQKSLKMTTEPPRGIKANMNRLFSQVTQDSFNRTSKQRVYQKLFMSLTFFHSILLERKKFLTLGWNVPCDFNDSDFEVCEKLLSVMIDEYKEVPWDALRYLIAEAHYGGRVTDEWDRRILKSYINHLFNEDAVNTENYWLSESPQYYMPSDLKLSNVKEYISYLPNHDNPDAFGQHANADISSQIRESKDILANLLSLQPQTASTLGMSKEARLNVIIQDLLKRLPENMDYVAAYKKVQHDLYDPMNVVLLQEIKRYNELLNDVKDSLFMLQKALKGFTLLTKELEEVSGAIYEANVPRSWKNVYASTKPLAAWVEDLVERVAYFNDWHTNEEPKIHWLAAFTFPTGFLTAVLQRAARKNNVPIDTLIWETNVLSEDTSLDGLPNDGIYLKRLFLEGAGWDVKNNCLRDALPMELTAELPVVQLRPVEIKKKSMKGIYTCPLYYYPIRAGTNQRPSFIIAIELKTGQHESDFFIRRGTAALASL